MNFDGKAIFPRIAIILRSPQAEVIQSKVIECLHTVIRVHKFKLTVFLCHSRSGASAIFKA